MRTVITIWSKGDFGNAEEERKEEEAKGTNVSQFRNIKVCHKYDFWI